MSIEETLQAALQSVAPAYQDTAPAGVSAPYIVWTEVVSQVNNSLSGPSGVQNAHLQVDVYAADQATRRSTSAAVAAAMLAISQTTQIASQNQYESETKLFRAVLEFSLWSM